MWAKEQKQKAEIIKLGCFLLLICQNLLERNIYLLFCQLTAFCVIEILDYNSDTWKGHRYLKRKM